MYGWIQGLVESDHPCRVQFADIQQLNELAHSQSVDLLKLSLYGYSKYQEHYQLLPIGTTLGFGVGPKIIARHPISELTANLIVALPGIDTTAAFLCKRFFPHLHHCRTYRYDEIEGAVLSGAVDLGVIIHETRFTFQQRGLHEVADLGKLWEKESGLPLPLGGLALRRTLGHLLAPLTTVITTSLDYAYAHRNEALDYALTTSDSKDKGVLEKHLALYVNAETRVLSPQGRRAVDYFLSETQKNEHHGRLKL